MRHGKGRKMSLPCIFAFSWCLQSSPRRKAPDSRSDLCYHTWSTCAWEPAALHGTNSLKGQWHKPVSSILPAFFWERLCSCSVSEDKIANLIPKISKQCSVSLAGLQLDEFQTQSHFHEIQEHGWEHNGKAPNPAPLLYLLCSVILSH